MKKTYYELWAELYPPPQICFPGSSDGKESACNEGDLSSTPGSGRPLEKEMVTHSNILAWRIP